MTQINRSENLMTHSVTDHDFFAGKNPGLDSLVFFPLCPTRMSTWAIMVRLGIKQNESIDGSSFCGFHVPAWFSSHHPLSTVRNTSFLLICKASWEIVSLRTVVCTKKPSAHDDSSLSPSMISTKTSIRINLNSSYVRSDDVGSEQFGEVIN